MIPTLPSPFMCCCGGERVLHIMSRNAEKNIKMKVVCLAVLEKES